MTDSTILFFDVEPQDRRAVLERYPSAKFAEPSLKEKALISTCKDADIVSIFINTPFPRSVIAELPTLKLLCTRSVGYDHIDTQACREHGITVCNVPDYGSHVIAEHVFALLLSTLRHVPEAEKRVESGMFDYHGLRGVALKGKTIGIVGTGKIGRCAARIAHGFDMRILATDQCRTLELEERLGVQYVPLEKLLTESDIITLHLPSTAQTRHLLGQKQFQHMKDGVTLVNTARGALIDSAALLKALNSGKVGHALLDVLEHENNFAENKELISHPNVVTTPHIAFYADDSMRNMYADCFQSIDEWRKGKIPTHAVKPVEKICDLPALKRS